MIVAGWVLLVKKSELATWLDNLQEKPRPFFKQKDFRIRNRTLNGISPDGLTQVVIFQMGSFDPPGTTYIPGLRENLCERFTFNLGIYVPEVALYSGSGEARAFIQDPHCCIRQRLGPLGPEHKDLWWQIRDDDQLVDEHRPQLLLVACPELGPAEGVLRDFSKTPTRRGRFCSCKSAILIEDGVFNERTRFKGMCDVTFFMNRLTVVIGLGNFKFYRRGAERADRPAGCVRHEKAPP